jgi:ABC-2 type transport system permease protein
MIARAAEQPELWPHFLALIWQGLWVALILKMASAVFRRSVLKSGRSRPPLIKLWASNIVGVLGLASRAKE